MRAAKNASLSCPRARLPRRASGDGSLVRRVRGRAADREGVAARCRDDRVAHARRAARLRRRHAPQRDAESSRRPQRPPSLRALRVSRRRCECAAGLARDRRRRRDRAALSHRYVSRRRLSAGDEDHRDVVQDRPWLRPRRSHRRAHARQSVAVSRERHRLRQLARQRRHPLAARRAVAAASAMLGSGACCLAIGFLYGKTPLALLALATFWGATVVADSAQFSACVTEFGDPRYLGTALTLQTCIGFLITTISIRMMPLLVARVGWEWAFAFLAPGPLLGIVAMMRLRKVSA